MRAPSTTMNSRVTKALLGTYSRRGPLFSVVYLAAARPRASAPAHACLSPALRPRRHASAPSARTGVRAPHVSCPVACRACPPLPQHPARWPRADSCPPRRGARRAAPALRARRCEQGAGGRVGVVGWAGGAPQVHLLAGALKPGRRLRAAGRQRRCVRDRHTVAQLERLHRKQEEACTGAARRSAACSRSTLYLPSHTMLSAPFRSKRTAVGQLPSGTHGAARLRSCNAGVPHSASARAPARTHRGCLTAPGPANADRACHKVVTEVLGGEGERDAGRDEQRGHVDDHGQEDDQRGQQRRALARRDDCR